jgi:hypothetical protein
VTSRREGKMVMYAITEAGAALIAAVATSALASA